MMKDQRMIQFDPRMFISPPFQKCPACNAEEYGVLTIHGTSYSRRCRKCRHTQHHNLPEIKKRIVYLDQFVVSNMMKALNPESPARTTGSLNEFWKTVFQKIDRLNKLQLIICPDSPYHKDESLLAEGHTADLQQMYEHLSDGASFKFKREIIDQQLCHVIRAWIRQEKLERLDLNPSKAIRGNLHTWQDRYRISVNMGLTPNYVQDMKHNRITVAAEIRRIFHEIWKKERKSKQQWYTEELSGFGEGLIKAYKNRGQQILSAARQGFIDVEKLLPDATQFTIAKLKRIFEKEGVPTEKFWDTLQNFLYSDEVSKIPCLDVSCWMFANMACKAQSQSDLDDSFPTDVDMISTVMPYSDAMFIDKACHGLIDELRRELAQYTCVLFSLRNKDDFIAYLDQIERDCPKEHFDKIREVYGESWEEPYETMYLKG